MNITLTRTTFTDQSTIGKLEIDGVHECYTLEPITHDGPKVQNKTSIPYGTYQVVIVPSPRFHRLMPRLENVPSFDGILMHVGNSAKDTDGCILLGQSTGKDYIYSSQAAWDAFYTKLEDAQGKITITITK